MPSYLGVYDGSARNRREKFIRAVGSFLNQSYENKELIIVSDGCMVTENTYHEHFAKCHNIKYKYLLKGDRFSGIPRQTGIGLATGEVITYLDTDDYFSPGHLNNIENGFLEEDRDWVYWSDYVKTGMQTSQLRNVSLAFSHIGTSCIAHKRGMDVSWEGCDGYGHDWTFIQKLMAASKNRKQIFGCGYYVCHIKDRIDV